MGTNNMYQNVVDTVNDPIHFNRGVIQMFHGNQIDVKIWDGKKSILRTFHGLEMVPMNLGDVVYISKCPDCGIEVLHRSPDIENYFAWRFYILMYLH